MVELTAQSPCAGLLPIERGSTRLEEVDPGPLATVAPYAGRHADLADALKKAHGLEYPAANTMSESGTARAIWFGRDMALLAGVAPHDSLHKAAAVTVQTDAWAAVELSGAGAEDVLARLVPVDLRAAHFPRGHTARTLLGHMTVSITRTGPDRLQILVFRSMAATLAHELQEAMEAVAARG